MAKLFRVALVSWLDNNNSDTDYLWDFRTQEKAIKFIDGIKDFILQEEQCFLEDIKELDLDIEEWDGDYIVGVVYSTRIWGK